jgi:hypothetical protein
MTTVSPSYAPPVRRRTAAAALDFELIDAAIELYDQGQVLPALHKVFAHVLPNQAAVDLSIYPISFTQGSSLVTARLEGDELIIAVPLVRLPSGGAAIAALRYVLSRINSTGQLYQARLRGDDLQLEFRDKLASLHPQKVLEVLRRMPVEADAHDDWMVSQFGAIALERAPIAALSDEEFARAEAVWRTHWNDVEELLKEGQRKRSVWFLNELTSFAHCRIRYALPLGGSVLPRLNESVRTFNDSDVDPTKRETTLARCVKEMKALSSDELRKSLGHATYAISPLGEGTADKLGGFFAGGNYIESIDKYRSTQPIDAGLALVGTYYYLLATFAWPDEVVDALEQGLAETAGKPWRDCANALFDHAKAVVEQFVDEDEGDEDDDDDEDDDEEAADE